MKASLINDLKAIHQEEYRSNGFISLDFAQRGIRYLFFAARFCNGKLRHEFVRLCNEALQLAKKYTQDDP